jgi:rubrerythrin
MYIYYYLITIVSSNGLISMSQESYRMTKLLEHWIEHNVEHVKRFRVMAEEASSAGLVDVAEYIRLAAEKGDEVTTHLQKALNSVKE